MSERIKIFTVFGTRPETIKLAPVLLRLAGDLRFESRTCNTGQHREMTDQALRLFKIRPDHSLRVMSRGQSLSKITSRVLRGLDLILTRWRPDAVLVQGDTNTTFAAALAAFHHRVPVAHLEAGLRTGDLAAPFPEEGNRLLTSRLAALHLAPTAENAKNLAREGIPARDIIVTGNTAVDAALDMRARVRAAPRSHWTGKLPRAVLDDRKRLILVTGHRRENLGAGLAGICRALSEIARKAEDCLIVYPVHRNPRVRRQVSAALGRVPNIILTSPLAYDGFSYLMDRSHFILTDSGGVQEEAPVFGKTVLLMREASERPEALRAKTAILVGTDPRRIVEGSLRLLAETAPSVMTNPFGDGRAARRVVEALRRRFAKDS